MADALYNYVMKKDECSVGLVGNLIEGLKTTGKLPCLCHPGRIVEGIVRGINTANKISAPHKSAVVEATADLIIDEIESIYSSHDGNVPTHAVAKLVIVISEQLENAIR